MRGLLIFIAIVLVIYFARRWIMLQAARWIARRLDLPQQAQAEPQSQRLIACAHCGVMLPQQDSVQKNNLPYCSGSHADSGPRKA